MSFPDSLKEIDIYLFDQLQRGRIVQGMRILDAGCGLGRNLVYFLDNGFDVRAVDRRRDSVEAVRKLASRHALGLPRSNFRVESVESMSFSDASVDVVICSALLHFADDEAHFNAMVKELWRVLSPGGLLFARLASTIGMNSTRFAHVAGRRFVQPDGDERFLVDAPLLLAATERLGGTLADPLKTTVVHDKRCMTTWVVRKPKTD